MSDLSLRLQKRIAADILKCGESRVRFDPERLDDIKSAITREEVKQLIDERAIYKVQAKGVSKGRKRGRKERRGPGSRKGSKYSVVTRKEYWIARVRAQRKELKRLRDSRMIDEGTYRKLYMMVKAGVFKSVNSLREYMKQNRLFRRIVI